jgi:hypothetical protein
MLRHVFEELGMHVWFRYEKYREEYAAEDVTIAIDETPVGTFVEIEGGEEAIRRMHGALGRSASDFILDSYRGLFIQHPRTPRASQLRHGLSTRNDSGAASSLRGSPPAFVRSRSSAPRQPCRWRAVRWRIASWRDWRRGNH